MTTFENGYRNGVETSPYVRALAPMQITTIPLADADTGESTQHARRVARPVEAGVTMSGEQAVGGEDGEARPPVPLTTISETGGETAHEMTEAKAIDKDLTKSPVGKKRKRGNEGRSEDRGLCQSMISWPNANPTQVHQRRKWGQQVEWTKRTTV